MQEATATAFEAVALGEIAELLGAQTVDESLTGPTQIEAIPEPSNGFASRGWSAWELLFRAPLTDAAPDERRLYRVATAVETFGVAEVYLFVDVLGAAAEGSEGAGLSSATLTVVDVGNELLVSAELPPAVDAAEPAVDDLLEAVSEAGEATVRRWPSVDGRAEYLGEESLSVPPAEWYRYELRVSVDGNPAVPGSWTYPSTAVEGYDFAVRVHPYWDETGV